MKTGILPYQKLEYVARSCGKARGRNILAAVLAGRGWLVGPAAFLLGRASIMGGLMPFGMAFFAAAYSVKVSRLVVSAAILAGMLSTGKYIYALSTLAGMLLFNIIQIPFRKHPRQSVVQSSAAGAAMLLSGSIDFYMQGMLVYDLIKAVSVSFVVFLLTFIFRNALQAAAEPASVKSFTNEQRISLAILSAIVLSGFGNFHLLGISIKSMLCILVILLFSFRCGPAAGSAIGVTVGLIISFSTPATPLIISSYAFCGLLAGVFRNLGKVGSSLGFILGNAALTMYINGSTDVLIYLKEILCGIALFLAMPAKAVDLVTGGFRAEAGIVEDKGSRSRIKDMTVERLNKFSKAFSEMSKTFSEISETATVADKQDITALFDSVADKVCRDCSLNVYCWDRNFYTTYQVMFKIVDRLDSKGRIDESDIPEYFMNKCERTYDFVKAVNSVYEVFKVNMVWRSRLGESRGMVSQQLEGLSRVISNLAVEIGTDVNFKDDLENIIQSSLLKAGIKASSVTAVENKCGKYDIVVTHPGCGGRRNCVSIIEKAVSSAAGRKMVKETSECFQNVKGSGCRLRLVEEEAFCVTTGIARIAKDGEAESGDSYTFMNTGEGKYIVALSDGMGSGHKAALQSKATINLIEQFMESGFDKDTTVKLINSLLVMKSTDDSFATIDMSVIDLYSGETEFVKIGAVPTYIKRGEAVQFIRSATLPAGILSNLELELKHEKINSGDFVIMVTDGVVDAFKNSEDDVEITDFLSSIKSINPQQIAGLLLDKACSVSGAKPADDMLVLVAKVWKRVK